MAASIETIRKSNKGRLTPFLVVTAASKKDHPLHPVFEWDDGKAAHQYRLDQARDIIRTVEFHMTVNRMQVTSVAYVRDPRKSSGEQGYIKLTDKMDKATARSILLAEFERVRSALVRAQKVAAVLGLQDELDEMLERLHGMSAMAEAAE